MKREPFIAVFLTFILLCGLSAELRSADSKYLTLDLLYDPDKKVDFDGSPPRIRGWTDDGLHYIEVKTDPDSRESHLLRVNARTGESAPLYDLEKIAAAFSGIGLSDEDALKLAKSGTFELSPDSGAVLITFNGDLFYYRISENQGLRLTESPQKEREASFSPDGKRIAFVRDRDLYVIDLKSGRDKRLTTGGGDNLFNGLLDWVYQEEIYGRGDFKAFWWSPDSSSLAYLQLDETPVQDFTVVDHIPQHLTTEVTRYPKAGDPNPKVRLGVVSAGGGKSRWVDLSRYQPEDLLIVRVGWTPDSRQLVFQAQNKAQTWLDLNFASRDGKRLKTAVHEESPAWVSVLGQPHWLQDGSFLWQSERSGWRHLYHYDRGGQLIGPVTSGDWEMRSLHEVDEENGWAYFSATERSPIGLDAYRARLDGSELKRLTEAAGTHRVRFNKQATLFVDSWSDVQTPTQTRVHQADGALVTVIDANPSEELNNLWLGAVEFLQVPTRDGFTMEAMMIKPPDFDPARRYPVMSYTYGGPHAPSVRNSWGGTTFLWHQMLAQKGYIIWICDNRTASGKGAESAWPGHRNLGELELRDLEDGLNWLKQHSWVNGGRIGLWGWSYGGFMTSYALTHSKSFRIGIVGAPVTDWSLYDTVYTERYMDTPQNNPEGYEKSSVIKAAGDLHGKMLLLHGTIDDNVHLQNSIQFMYELQKAGKEFEVMFYPKSRHGVRNGRQVKHMRELMTRFILENL